MRVRAGLRSNSRSNQEMDRLPKTALSQMMTLKQRIPDGNLRSLAIMWCNLMIFSRPHPAEETQILMFLD